MTWFAPRLALLLLFTAISTQTSSIDPAIVQDEHGNLANESSHITWGPLPNADYTQTANDRQGLAPFFDMTRGFINVVQPNDLGIMYDILADAQKSQLNIESYQEDLIKYMMGYIVCLAIGVLFVIIMPIVGCCFCCCRCCGNCGGKREQKKPSNTRCKVYTAIHVGLTAFLATGMGLLWATNQRMSTSVNKFIDIASDNLNDVDLFISTLSNQTDHIGATNYGFTKSVIERDLDNRGIIFGGAVQDALDEVSDVYAVINTLLDFDETIQEVAQQMIQVNDSINEITEQGEELESELSTIKTDIDVTFAACSCGGGHDTSGLQMGVNFNNLPDIKDEVDKIEDVRDSNITALVLEGKKDFDDIPEKVHNDTIGIASDLETQLDDFGENVDDELEKVKKLEDDVDFSNLQEQLEDVSETIEPYDHYRWLAGVGLCSVVTLIVVLQVMGLLLGICGYSSNAEPSKRGCASNSGGNMLMAAVAFTFLFCSLLMLLTSISFLFGCNMEKVLCQPLMDPEYEIFTELIDKPGDFYDDYLLGNMLHNNGSINITIHGTLESCRQNEPAYEVLELHRMFNVESATDYKDNVNFEEELNKTNVDLSDLVLLSNETIEKMNDLKSAVAIDYKGFDDELSKATTDADLLDFADSLDTLADGVPETHKSALQGHATDLRNLHATTYTTVDMNKNNLKKDIEDLQSMTNDVPNDVDNAIAAAKTAENDIRTQGDDVIDQEAKVYSERLLSVIDSYVDFATTQLTQEMARCEPVWNIWYSIVHVSICGYIVDSFNGFWFSLGWCLFFMVPGAIFNVKLAKHYRRMNPSRVGHSDYLPDGGLV